MRVVIESGIDRWQEIGRGELPHGGGLENARAGDVEFGVLHVRELEGGRQVDRLGLERRGSRAGWRAAWRTRWKGFQAQAPAVPPGSIDRRRRDAEASDCCASAADCASHKHDTIIQYAFRRIGLIQFTVASCLIRSGTERAFLWIYRFRSSSRLCDLDGMSRCCGM